MEAAVPLRRRLGLALLVLYGTGITVGAGIYVLIGAVAGHAGVCYFTIAQRPAEIMGGSSQARRDRRNGLFRSSRTRSVAKPTPVHSRRSSG
jgi:hypothetical protein